MKPCVLLTGVTGFIGSHVAERLLQDDLFRVIAIVRKANNEAKIESLKQKGAFITTGIFYDENLLKRIFSDYLITHVVHLAAIRGEGKGRKQDYYKVNVHGTEILLEASLRNHIRQFIYCSSVGVFGTIPTVLPANLATPLNGDTLYHDSKIQAEDKVHHFVQKGLEAHIIRPSITYGVGDNGFPSKLITIARKRVPLLPIGENFVHLLDVRSLARVLSTMLTIDLKKRVLIVADKEPIRLRELVDLIYYHYNGREYPCTCRPPEFMTRTALLALKGLGSKKWLAKLRLISESWCYDVEETTKIVMLEMAETRKEFLRFIETVA